MCVTVLRRSGETLQMVSEWQQIEKFSTFVRLFANKELASKLPYDIAHASYALSTASEMSAAEIRRLVKRHSTPNINEADDTKRRELTSKWIQEQANDLQTWSSRLPRQVEELADWLSLARFVSQGGNV